VDGLDAVPRGEQGAYTAVAEPEGAPFPRGWPKWSGEATNPENDERVTVEVRFEDWSDFIGDFKVVTANCGSSVARARLHVYLVDFVLPQDTDFAQFKEGRVLISTKMGGGYHTAFQRFDGSIDVEAHIRPPLPGKAVTFEVIDPDDSSPYDEDGNAETIFHWTLRGAPYQIENAAQNSEPNDNRDRGVLHLRPGTFWQYNIFQSAAFAGRVQGTDPMGIARTTLTITDRFAGDNYVVRATCRGVGVMPFNAGSHVSGTPGYHANLPDVDVRASTELQAWKRVYYEKDTMYRQGAFLAHPERTGTVWVDVLDRTAFRPGCTVRVLDERGSEPACVVLDIRPDRPVPANAPEAARRGSLLLSIPLSGGYGFRGSAAYVGIETGNAAADFFVPDTGRLPDTFDDAYVEWIELSQRRQAGVPRHDYDAMESVEISCCDTGLGWSEIHRPAHAPSVGTGSCRRLRQKPGFPRAARRPASPETPHKEPAAPRGNAPECSVRDSCRARHPL
jgi:hypothetical protein